MRLDGEFNAGQRKVNFKWDAVLSDPGELPSDLYTLRMLPHFFCLEFSTGNDLVYPFFLTNITSGDVHTVFSVLWENPQLAFLAFGAYTNWIHRAKVECVISDEYAIDYMHTFAKFMNMPSTPEFQELLEVLIYFPRLSDEEKANVLGLSTVSFGTRKSIIDKQIYFDIFSEPEQPTTQSFN